MDGKISKLASKKVLGRALLVVLSLMVLAGLWASPPVREAWRAYRRSRPIEVRITDQELLLDGARVAPVRLDPRNNELDYPDSAYSGVHLGALVEALSNDSRERVFLEADSATPYRLYMTVMGSLREAGKHDLTLAMPERKEVAAPLYEPGPVMFVSLSRRLDTSYVVIVDKKFISFHRDSSSLPRDAYSGLYSGVGLDSLASMISSASRTPTRRSILLNLQVNGGDFGRLHRLLRAMRDANDLRPVADRMRIELNVHPWHPWSTLMMCGPTCNGNPCVDFSQEEGLWGEDPDSASKAVDPNAPNLIDSILGARK